MAFNYSIYGMSIESDIELKELLHSSKEPQIKITTGEVPKAIENTLFSDHRIQVNHNEFLLNVKEIGKFYVKNSDTIIIEPQAGVDPEYVKTYLYGSTLTALLIQKGYYLLHASVVKFNNKAVLFIGGSGSGKSSIASFFYKEGHKVLSDDIAAIRIEDDKITVIPSLPRFKLKDSVLDEIGEDSSKHKLINDSHQKKGFSVKDGFYESELEIDHIYKISINNETSESIKAIQAVDSILILRKNTYRYKQIRAMHKMDWHFQKSMQITNNISFSEIIRNDNSKLSDICEMIKKDIEE